MRYLLAYLLAAIIAAAPALAQEAEPGFFGRLFGGDDETAEDPGGFIENLIEENLSSDVRSVRITGFEGALSGRATLETLTIADAEGVWLTLENAVLDWNRTALLRGRLEVAELSAARIELPRLPVPGEAAGPAPEATGFSLPELPVSVNIEKIDAAEVFIGASLYGAETLASVAGSLTLADGDGSAVLQIDRLNGDGTLSLDASYSNASEILALDLSLAEGPGGIFATLVNLPGRPAVEFSVAGEAPVTEYAANIRLATDGEERLTGRVTTERPEDLPDAELRLLADIRGDIAPIFAPEYRAFFGPDVSLRTRVTTFSDSRTVIDHLAVRADALTLDGIVEIAGGLPRRIDLTGEIAASDGGPVLLPLAGPETRVDSVDLVVGFDAAEGDQWRSDFTIDGLDRPGFSAERLALVGTGRIRSAAARGVTATLTFDATALDLGNAEAEEALGESVTGGLALDWQEGAPLTLTGLRIDGETYGLVANAVVTFAEGGPEVEGEARVTADRLSAFSGLARRSLGGAARLDTAFTAAPLAGTFDVTATGQTTDLVVSQPEADRILAGEARLDVSAVRDETGIRIVLRELTSPNAEVSGTVTLSSGGSSVATTARLADVALVLPRISGPLTVDLDANEAAGVWAYTLASSLPSTRLETEGTVTDLFGTPIVTTSGTLSADQLANFGELLDRPLSGSVNTAFSAEVVTDLSRATLDLTGTLTDLNIGQPQVDTLLVGGVAVDIDAALAGEVYTLRDSSIRGPNIELDADGILTATTGTFTLRGRLPDAARLLPDAPEGPLDVRAATERDGDDWSFDVAVDSAALTAAATGVARAPTGPDAAIEGRVTAEAPSLSAFATLAGRPIAGRLDLDAEGRARFDLSSLDLTAAVEGAGLRTGIAELDRLLAGTLSANASVARKGDAIRIETLDASTDLLTLTASGAVGVNGSTIALDARLADVAPFAPGFSGPLTATGTVGQREDGRYTLDIDANGPGGTTAQIAGDAAPDASDVDVTATGNAPLGLANAFISPRTLSGRADFDLRLNGAPALANLSGSVASPLARLAAPELGLSLDDIVLDARLGGSQVTLDIIASPSTGGRLDVAGSVGLTGGTPADLTITLGNAVLTDPRLYETTLNGRLTVVGPLAGGARIAGDITLGETNVQIPSTGLGGAGDVPEVIHINEPPPVRGTRRRAGLLEAASDSANGGGPVYPLDIRVNAPNRIFVRGRGLDSEFGGSLRITGTTADVVPIGAFNLIRGRLDILGNRLDIEEATISMQGSFVPILRIIATTQADEVLVSIVVAGPASNPEITFQSQPELPQEEVLSRLIFGRGIETLSALQAARLALAVRTLAGQGGEGLVGNIRSGAGLADLDVTTDEEGNAAVRAGAYLGDDIYTDVTVGAGGETELNLNYDLTPSVTLKGSTANTGESSVGIFFERDY